MVEPKKVKVGIQITDDEGGRFPRGVCGGRASCGRTELAAPPSFCVRRRLAAGWAQGSRGARRVAAPKVGVAA